MLRAIATVGFPPPKGKRKGYRGEKQRLQFYRVGGGGTRRRVKKELGGGALGTKRENYRKEDTKYCVQKGALPPTSGEKKKRGGTRVPRLCARKGTNR